MNRQIGKVNKKVIKLLSLEYKEELPIILGDSNIEHMKRQHPQDYYKYGDKIMDIVNNPNQGSIEYIKEYKVDNEFILVAVRISNRGTMFAKTMFKMTERKIKIYLQNGYAKKYK
ncbi:MAG: transposase [Clostridia bacterium]|nr:transposase [Clostridia bacterium]